MERSLVTPKEVWVRHRVLAWLSCHAISFVMMMQDIGTFEIVLGGRHSV